MREEQDDQYALALALDRSKEDQKQLDWCRAMAKGGVLQICMMLGYIMQTPEVRTSLETWQETLDFEKQQSMRVARIAALTRKTE